MLGHSLQSITPRARRQSLLECEAARPLPTSASHQRHPDPDGSHQSSPIPPTTSQSPVYTHITRLKTHPLPCDWQLPPQTLEAAFSQTSETPIQLLLELVLRLCNLPYHTIRAATRNLHLLARRHPHIAIFVVVHVDFDCPTHGVRGRIKNVRATPPPVPEVLWRVFGGDEKDSDSRVGVDGVDAYG